VQIAQRRRRASAHVLEGGKEAHAQTGCRLAAECDQSAIDGDDRVTRRRRTDRADQAARKDASLQKRLCLVGRQVDEGELDGLPQRDVPKTQSGPHGIG
jgi:hypothetical protein